MAERDRFQVPGFAISRGRVGRIETLGDREMTVITKDRYGAPTRETWPLVMCNSVPPEHVSGGEYRPPEFLRPRGIASGWGIW